MVSLLFEAPRMIEKKEGTFLREGVGEPLVIEELGLIRQAGTLRYCSLPGFLF